MKELKKYGISFLFFISILMIGTLFLNTLSFFNVIGSTTIKIFSYLIFFISFFVSGFINGKKSVKKGWLEGLKFGLLLIFVIQLFNFLLFHVKFRFSYIIFELISLLVIIFGSMIGINKKNDT